MQRVAEKTSEIDVTPMLDVVFILLIFFVVTSTFDRSSVVDVQRSSGGPQDATEALAIRVDRDGIYLDENAVSPDGLAARLSVARGSQKHVVIASNSDAPVRLVVAAIDAARSAGFDPGATVLALAE